ncbi:MAG: glycerol-3-phosphate 1-O-acyltransferase PlsY [Elainellaceae cyanobacterium]
MTWFVWLGAIFSVAYLLGSLPTGYLAGRMLKDIDIRQHGSGSTGATNVLRVLGKGPGAAVLAIDVLKGALAIIAARWVSHLPNLTIPTPPGIGPASWPVWLAVAAGLGVLLGHSRSLWLRFSGGKSVASGLGVLFALHWPTALIALAVFSTVLALSKIVSLSSLITALSVPAIAILFNRPLPTVLFVLAAAGYILLTHKTNIQRIIKGTEFKLGQKKSATG